MSRDPQPAAPPVAIAVGGSAGYLRRARALGRLARDAALAPVYRTYAARLRAQVLAHPVPAHVALIMDGNRRWARQLGLREVRAGHSQGADKAVELLGWCSSLGIREVTLWALSLENLDRSAEEVEAITEIARETLEALAERDRAHRLGMSLQVIGRRDLLPERLREAAERGEAETRGRSGPAGHARPRVLGARRAGRGRPGRRPRPARRRNAAGRPRGRPDRRRPGRPAVHARLVRPGADHPDLGRGPPLGLPALAERVQRVLLLRRLLAGVPRDRLPARHPHLPATGSALRALTGRAPDTSSEAVSGFSPVRLSKSRRPPTISQTPSPLVPRRTRPP